MLIDKLGIEIKIGDLVVSAKGPRNLVIGHVIRMNKYVSIVSIGSQYPFSKPPEAVVVINEQMKYNKDTYPELYI